MDTTVIFLVVLAILTGALGYWLGARPLAGLQREKSALEERGVSLEERALALEDDFKRAGAELGAAQIEIATLKANAENFDKQIDTMKAAKDDLLNQFKATGAEVLSRAQERFIADAAERFGHAEKANKEAVASLLKPVNDRLTKYEEQVGSLERQRSDAFARLHQQIETMRLGQEEVRREAQRLGNSLTNAPKARGRWGERALQNLLEQCGLAQHTDFHLEQSLQTDGGRLRPDAIVNVPGQKKLVIDSKVSLNAYQAAFDADDDDERKRHMALHAKSMRNHVQTLGAKSYQSQFEEAPDYVVMFVPGEHFVAAALEADPQLWDFAFDNKVLLA
ncbi:MAG: DNA recombination protein RmuC, partial [Alteraurantiacibacter sp. bin_em_oilr2.035]|nr:DNA recombination protein RmuC [Alteraurantiacibacter sp. bin_em_oilr2.035]